MLEHICKVVVRTGNPVANKANNP